MAILIVAIALTIACTLAGTVSTVACSPTVLGHGSSGARGAIGVFLAVTFVWVAIAIALRVVSTFAFAVTVAVVRTLAITCIAGTVARAGTNRAIVAIPRTRAITIGKACTMGTAYTVTV